MKRLSYKMLVESNGKRWVEEISDNVAEDVTAFEHAKDLLKRFNSRGTDPVRTVILTRNNLNGIKKHDFQKHSLVTQKGGYDVYKCSRCGLMGKRHGLSSTVVPNKDKPCK